MTEQAKTDAFYLAAILDGFYPKWFVDKDHPSKSIFATEKRFISACRIYYRHKQELNLVAFGLHHGIEYLYQNKEEHARFATAITSECISKEVRAESARQHEQLIESRRAPKPTTPAKQPRMSNVYLMRNARNGYTKIGISDNPKIREHALQSEEPEVYLVCSRKGTRYDEMELHNRFASLRVRGEWFSLTDQQTEQIKLEFQQEEAHVR